MREPVWHTDAISAQIASMQAATNQAVAAVQEISTTVQDIDAISNSIAAAVEEQSSATLEITRNVQQAAEGKQSVSENTWTRTPAPQDRRPSHSKRRRDRARNPTCWPMPQTASWPGFGRRKASS